MYRPKKKFTKKTTENGRIQVDSRGRAQSPESLAVPGGIQDRPAKKVAERSKSNQATVTKKRMIAQVVRSSDANEDSSKHSVQMGTKVDSKVVKAFIKSAKC